MPEATGAIAMETISALITLHLLASVIWVGGMFFAYMALRPTAAQLLEPPLRLPLWAGTFKRFFPWVWGCVVILPTTGIFIITQALGGMENAGTHVHIMMLLGTVMIALFLYLYFWPYRKLTSHCQQKAFKEAASQLNIIRKVILINLTLGIFTVIIAGFGR